MRIDPASPAPITLVADKVIPPITPPADTDMVKRIKIQSEILTKWWGQPIYLGATILLPKDYDKHPDVKYPINYIQGHFSLNAPGGFGRGGEFDKVWMAETTPRFIYVTLQHPSPCYDDSYAVNSENNGPYGDAIMQELLPAIETKFRVIRQPSARMLSDDRPGAGSPRPTRSSIRISTAPRSPAARTRWTSTTTRSSTSTRMPTPTTSIRAG